MEQIQEGFAFFVRDGAKAVGAVRQVRDGELVVYIENTGDFELPLAAVRDVHDEKVLLDGARLPPRLMEAIARAHVGEDPRIP